MAKMVPGVLAAFQHIDAACDAITVANGNEVANFDIHDTNGSAIAGSGLTGNANLHDLAVTNGTGVAISLTDVATTSAGRRRSSRASRTRSWTGWCR